MNLNKEELVDALEEVLNNSRAIDNETHKMHHQFITGQIDQMDSRKKLFMKFKLSLVGTLATGVVAALVWIGKLVWDSVSRGHH